VQKPALDLAGELHFDPLGLAIAEPGLKLNPAAVGAAVASTLAAAASANSFDPPVSSYISQDLKDQQEFVFLTVIALLCFSSESVVLLSQLQDDFLRRGAGIPSSGDGKWIEKQFQPKLQGGVHFTFGDINCFPVDWDCDTCERNDELSEYYGEEIWLCVND
jgi:hypothetical protein